MKKETRVSIPVRCVKDAYLKIQVDAPPGLMPNYEYWVFDEFQIIDSNEDATEAAKMVRQLQLKVDAQAGQYKELQKSLSTSQAGALRYQTKFETLSELFDRVLSSLKQER